MMLGMALCSSKIVRKDQFINIIKILNQWIFVPFIYIKHFLNIDLFYCLKFMFSLLSFGTRFLSEPGMESNSWCHALGETFPCLNKGGTIRDGTLFK